MQTMGRDEAILRSTGADAVNLVTKVATGFVTRGASMKNTLRGNQNNVVNNLKKIGMVARKESAKKPGTVKKIEGY